MSVLPDKWTAEMARKHHMMAPMPICTPGKEESPMALRPMGVIFMRAESQRRVSYADRKGKYQAQKQIHVAKV